MTNPKRNLGHEPAVVPRNLKECAAVARNLMSEDDLATFRAMNRDDLIGTHFSVGLFVRNQWLRPKDSPLMGKFVSLGLFFPDDISGIVVEAMWILLKGEVLDRTEARRLIEAHRPRLPATEEMNECFDHLIGDDDA